MYEFDSICPEEGRMVGCREYGDEPSDSRNYGEFLDQVKNHQLMENASSL